MTETQANKFKAFYLKYGLPAVISTVVGAASMGLIAMRDRGLLGANETKHLNDRIEKVENNIGNKIDKSECDSKFKELTTKIDSKIDKDDIIEMRDDVKMIKEFLIKKK
jgi:hypothetical protein